MTKSLIIFAALLFYWGTSASANNPTWQSYTLSRYPISVEGCKKTARVLGEQFTKVTGQEVYRASCENESKEGYEILLTYVATAPIQMVSTIQESGGLGYNGIYRTLSDCQSSLPNESKTFMESTGLTPFVSYCFKESAISLTPYLARIDALGEAKLYPFRFEGTIFAGQIDKSQEVLDAVLKATKDSGIGVHQVTFAHDGSLKLVVRFYGSAKETVFHSQYFKMDEVARYSSLGTRNPMGACRQQLSESEKGFSSSFTQPGIWFCAWDGMLFESKLYLLRIRRQEGINAETLPDHYSTFEACDRERPSLLAWYEKAFKITPFAVVCTWKNGLATGKSNSFVMRVLTKTSIEQESPSWGDIDL